MSLSTLVFRLFDVENIRRHDGCNKWWRWLQLMFREGWRGLHDSFDELVPLITQEICFEYFWNLAGTLFMYKFHTISIITMHGRSLNIHIMKQNSIVTSWHSWVIFKVRVLKFDTFGPLSVFLGVSGAFCWLSNIYIFDKLLYFDK